MPVEVSETALPEVKLIVPRLVRDRRGGFSEPYNKRDLALAGIAVDFVQDSQALSRRKGTVRGLHFQAPPAAQAKLVRVGRGAIFDVVVDLRAGAPSFGRWLSAELSRRNRRQLYIPVGFAHGYCTLADDVEVLYKVSDFYAPEHERGLLWNDPGLAIPWPVTPTEALLSERDSALPRLADLGAVFTYHPGADSGRGNGAP